MCHVVLVLKPMVYPDLARERFARIDTYRRIWSHPDTMRSIALLKKARGWRSPFRYAGSSVPAAPGRGGRNATVIRGTSPAGTSRES